MCTPNWVWNEGIVQVWVNYHHCLLQIYLEGTWSGKVVCDNSIHIHNTRHSCTWRMWTSGYKNIGIGIKRTHQPVHA